MKKGLVLVISCILVLSSAFGQGEDKIKKPSLAIQFFFNDFKSAAAVRATSVNIARRDDKFGNIKEMNAGVALNYLQGLSKYVDFSSTLGASFLDYPMDDKPAFGNQNLLLEATASLHAKLLPDNYCVVPYISAGLGASTYQGYYGAFMPLGGGLQVNLFEEAFILLNAQYRIKITETTNYHFYYSIGIAGNLDILKK